MRQLLSKIRKTLSYHFERAVVGSRGLRWDFSRTALKAPIFVIGCSRAGTTVVYKTLSESRQLGSLQRETHDFWMALHPLAQREWRTHALTALDASERDREVVSRHFFANTGRLRIIDKNNQNGLCVSYLYRLFPDAHFVFVRRSPGDNIHSLIEGWGKANEFATWSSEIPADVRVDSGRYRRWCFFLFDGWQRFADAPIEAVCAAQYFAMNRAILDASRSIPRSQWTDIVYEDLVQDPLATFDRTFAACNLEFTMKVRRHCSDLLARPYNAFSAIRLGKWREQGNRERIERVLPSVEALAREMGYVS